MLRRTIAISRKELRQLKRDTRLLFVIFFFPVFLLVIFGYAISFDVKHTTLAVLDKDKSTESRNFINSLIQSDYFDLHYMLDNEDQIDQYLDEKKIQCVAVLPVDFSKSLLSNRNVDVQFLFDGIDGNTAAILQNYVIAATVSYNKNLIARAMAYSGRKIYLPISLETRFWFNPDLETRRFLIPGLIAMILIVTAAVTVSLSLVREKERGTIEQLNVSAISSIELIFGKTFPYIVLALINASFILLASYILFGIEIKGSIILLFITTLIFLSAATSIGIFVSAISDSQQLAFSMATSLSLLPSVILSGFIFPIDSMPPIIQFFTNITPAKYFIVILRAIIIRGVGPESFWQQIIYLLIFTTVVMGLAAIISRKKAAA